MLCQPKLDFEWYYGWDHSLVFVQMPESLAPSVLVMIWIMNGRDFIENYCGPMSIVLKNYTFFLNIYIYYLFK